MIKLTDYWMGRDKLYAADLSDEIKANAALLVRRVNSFLALFYEIHPDAVKRRVNSGWRPPAVNKSVKKAAKKSNHMTGHAVDLGDDDEMLDKWASSRTGIAAMTACGLYMEHPSATPRWAHFQDVAPGSGKRVFYP